MTFTLYIECVAIGSISILYNLYTCISVQDYAEPSSTTVLYINVLVLCMPGWVVLSKFLNLPAFD